MIQVIPSMHVRGGQCVGLEQGNVQKAVLYDKSPLDVALILEDLGIRWLHFVDLDGLQQLRMVNDHALRCICNYTNLSVDFTGGVRTGGNLHNVLQTGAQRVTIGTVAVTDELLFDNWLISFGQEKIILSVDVKDDYVFSEGWLIKNPVTWQELIEKYHSRGLTFVKSTDITRQGMLEGPAIDYYRRVVEEFPDIKLIAHGGIRSLKDVEALEKIGVHGAIIGKALWEDHIDLQDLKAFNAERVSA